MNLSFQAHTIICLLFCFAMCTAIGASAQDSKEVEPPRLLQFRQAVLPVSEDGDLPDAGTVSARLSIDETGYVTAVKIEEATHPFFVAPATAAMQQFVFSPALRAGRPIASVVLYRYRFDAHPQAEPSATPVLIAAIRKENASAMDEMKDAPLDPSYVSEVHGYRIYEGVAEYRLEADQIKRIPGIHGDAVLAIQTLPGVAKPPAMLGALFIRGSSDADSLSLVDSLKVPSVFHFGSVNTILNSDLIDTVSFFPGNFSVRYGRATGGVVDIHTRAPKTDRLHAYIDADLWDVAAFIEGPISKHWSATASFRRSYIDGVLRATGLLENQLQFTVAPRYYDFQLKADYHSGKKNDLSILVFGSDDKVAFGDGVLASSGYLTREIYTRTYFYMAGITWRCQLHRRLSNELSIRGGYSLLRGDGAAQSSETKSIPVDFREEVAVTVSPELLLRLGTDSGAARHVLLVSDKFEGNETTETKVEMHPSAYLELVLLAVPKTKFVYGLRADYDGINGNWTADPRVEAEYTPIRGTVFRSGLGLFHQPPGLYRAFDDDLDLKSMSAIHYSLAVNQTVPHYELLQLDVGGFYKDLRRTSFSVRGAGRAAGLEMMLRHRPGRHFFGWVSYTLMKSERFRDSRPDEAVPFDFDQTHVLSVVAGVSLPHHVSVGLRFRFASGFPYTPIVGTEFYDDWFASQIPVWGEENSGRMPLFHQLDLRVDKTFEWQYLKVSIYVDVQNVYNRQNAVVYLYSSDFNSKKTVYDLPVLPSIGLKLEY